MATGQVNDKPVTTMEVIYAPRDYQRSSAGKYSEIRSS
jgi:hypothetical protein